MLLHSIFVRSALPTSGGYPFSLPYVRAFTGMSLDSAVTFFAGENGAGKSTLLEAIAAGTGCATLGGVDVRDDPTLGPARTLARHLSFAWRQRSHRGFFLRAEDFFNYANRVNELARELEEIAEGFEETLHGDGLRRAQGMARGQREALLRRHGGDLHARSHGESFMQVFQSRFVPGGLYLLDEPDTALSPLRQLALAALLKDMVAQDAQFIIATHSPILLALPDARIFHFDGTTIIPSAYEALESVQLWRDFLAHPATFMRRL